MDLLPLVFLGYSSWPLWCALSPAAHSLKPMLMQSTSIPTAPFHDELDPLGAISERQPRVFLYPLLGCIKCFGRCSYRRLRMCACLFPSMCMHGHFPTLIG